MQSARNGRNRAAPGCSWQLYIDHGPYYYPPRHHVLKNLADGRIKISSFARCNDPFELAGFNMQRGARYWYRATKLTLSRIFFPTSSSRSQYQLPKKSPLVSVPSALTMTQSWKK